MHSADGEHVRKPETAEGGRRAERKLVKLSEQKRRQKSAELVSSDLKKPLADRPSRAVKDRARRDGSGLDG